MADIANKEESTKCLMIARRCLQEGDFARAEKFAQKALKMYKSSEALAILHQAETLLNGASSPQTQQPTSAPEEQAGPKLPKRPDGVRHRSHATATPPKEDTSTPEQRQLVQQILAAKDFYEILGVTKEGSDDDIKKAYRKLALKLHPDKNKAHRAEDAFKAVSKAFMCLSDGDKRAYYDRTGYESATAAQSAAAATPRGRGGPAYYTADDIDPEEIFNMFFGGGFGPGVRVFRGGPFGAPPRRQAAGAAPPTERSMMRGFVQFLPIILIIVVSLFQGNSSAPIFSLTKDKSYATEVLTRRLSVPYYVRSEAELQQTYPSGGSARWRLERQVEEHYMEKLQARCTQEKLSQHRLWTWGSREEANSMKLPSCDEVSKLLQKGNSEYSRQQQRMPYY